MPRLDRRPGRRRDTTLDGSGCVHASGALFAAGYTSVASGDTDRLIADMHRAAGDVEAGLAMVAAGLAAAEQSDERNAEPELYRIRGELLAAGAATSDEPRGGGRLPARGVAGALPGVDGVRPPGGGVPRLVLGARGRAPEAERLLADLAQPPAEDAAT